jgi:PAS domain S-box-containing protein
MICDLRNQKMAEKISTGLRHPPKYFNLRNKMMLSFGLLFVAVFITVSIVTTFGLPFTNFRGSYGHERTEALRNLNFIASLKEERFQLWISERNADMQMIAEQEVIVRSTVALRQTVRERHLLASTQILRQEMDQEIHYRILREHLITMKRIYKVYNTFCIIDAQLGICCASTDKRHIGESVRDRAFVHDALQEGYGQAIDLELDAISNKPNIIFSRTIIDSEGRPLAVLVAHVDADAFIKPMLYAGEGLGKTDEIMIVDERARPLVQLRYPMANGETADVLKDSIQTKQVQFVIQGKEGVTTSTDYRGVPVLAAYRFIQVTPIKGLGMIVKRDEAEIMMSIWKRLVYTLVVAFCGILVALALTAVNAARISKPITDLSHTAHEVEAGNLQTRAKVKGADELGTLAQTFNSMLDRIGQWHEELEREVEIRSSALRKINKELEFRISERERAENALLESKNFTERLIDLMKDGFYVIDTNGVHINVNESLCKMTAFSAEELIGVAPPHPYWPEEEIKRIQEAFRKTRKGEFEDFDLIFKRKNGERFPVLVSPSHIKDADGNVTAYFATVKDISERKLAVEALRQSEEKYRQHFENASDVIYSIDRNACILSVSPSVEKVLGYTPEELVGKSIADLNIIAPEYKEAVAFDISRVFEGEQIRPSVYEFLSKNGERRFGEVSGAPLYRNRKIVGIISVARDITERRRAEDEIRNINRALRVISNCNIALIRATEERDLLSNICRLICEIGGYALASVGYMQDDKHKTISIVAQAGNKQQYLKNLKLTWADNKAGRNPFGIAIRTGENYLCHDIEKDPNYTLGRAEALKNGHRSLIVLPLMYRGKAHGVLSIHASTPNAFDEREIALLQELADDLIFGIQALRAHIAREEASGQLERSYEKLRKTLEETVNALASATEKRDPYTAGHQRWVTQLAYTIAQEMNMTENQIEGIRIAGVLHDIGKISVPAEILSKPGKLSDSEFSIIKLHSEIGYDILKTINFPWPVAQITLQHHERINGSGYPRGLSGDKILIEAKIIAVADVVEAMSSHRPYRPARTIKETLEEISKNKNVLYDSQVVDVCLRLFTQKKFKFVRT